MRTRSPWLGYAHYWLISFAMAVVGGVFVAGAGGRLWLWPPATLIILVAIVGADLLVDSFDN